MRTVAKQLLRIAVSLLALWLVAGGFRGDGARWLIASAGSNPIAVENAQTGNPASEWDITGAGDPSIQGFATDISVNTGQTVNFKIKTDSTNYKIDIYRLGYYGGAGARKIATLGPFTQPQNQTVACATDTATGLVDCGNWAVSASWPSTGAVSGIYLAKLTRDRHRRVEPHRLHRARRRAPGRRGRADLRHDVAGVQPVRRRQPVLRRTGQQRGHGLYAACHASPRR